MSNMWFWMYFDSSFYCNVIAVSPEILSSCGAYVNFYCFPIAIRFPDGFFFILCTNYLMIIEDYFNEFKYFFHLFK